MTTWGASALRVVAIDPVARSYHDPRFDLLRALRALDTQTQDTPDWPATDPAKTVRPVDGWDDVHGWPWDGER